MEADSRGRLDGHLLNEEVLVLNLGFEPVHVTRARRALLLLFRGKAQLVENGRGEIHTTSVTITLPSVIRLEVMARRPLVPRRLTRREVLVRDKFTCQYCGAAGRDLTLDHVYPRHRGGQNTWENVVGACIPCNRRKAGRTPQEAGMRLLRSPSSPRPNPYYPFYRYLARRVEWWKFFPEEERFGVSYSPKA